MFPEHLLCANSMLGTLPPPSLAPASQQPHGIGAVVPVGLRSQCQLREGTSLSKPAGQMVGLVQTPGLWSRDSLLSTLGKASKEGLTDGLMVHHGYLQAS